MSSTIPAALTLEEVQHAFQQVWSVLNRTSSPTGTTGVRNMSGFRITNMGASAAKSDAITRGEVDARILPPTPTTPPINPATVAQTFTGGSVTGSVIFLGPVLFPGFTDGTAHHCILFVNSAGELAVDENHLSYNDVLQELDIGYADKLVWFNQAAIASPAAGVLQLLNNLFTAFTRLVLGPATSSGVAIAPATGTPNELVVQLGDGSNVAAFRCGAFGCNGAAAQTPTASGGGLATYADGPHGLDTQANMQALFNCVAGIRVTLVNAGLMT